MSLQLSTHHDLTFSAQFESAVVDSCIHYNGKVQVCSVMHGANRVSIYIDAQQHPRVLSGQTTNVFFPMDTQCCWNYMDFSSRLVRTSFSFADADTCTQFASIMFPDKRNTSSTVSPFGKELASFPIRKMYVWMCDKAQWARIGRNMTINFFLQPDNSTIKLVVFDMKDSAIVFDIVDSHSTTIRHKRAKQIQWKSSSKPYYGVKLTNQQAALRFSSFLSQASWLKSWIKLSVPQSFPISAPHIHAEVDGFSLYLVPFEFGHNLIGWHGTVSNHDIFLQSGVLVSACIDVRCVITERWEMVDHSSESGVVACPLDFHTESKKYKQKPHIKEINADDILPLRKLKAMKVANWALPLLPHDHRKQAVGWESFVKCLPIKVFHKELLVSVEATIVISSDILYS